ncbi:MAG: gliding motility-associated C-terminal domain-containing protein, partial [Cyclobacteriaceae bacterium]|nr:gliding motility-associated C-terminal domain-containing protein [Cyclobacteriaceae bacterium]
LVLYFDELNGAPGAKDGTARVSIFSKRTNQFLFSISLPLTSESAVNYTQPECSKGELVTKRLLYSSVITLDPDVFKDSQGYYVSWERCCRNYNIFNIYSEDPNNGGTRFAGQTFYLEFPPVVVDGEPFVDSTPRLFPPLNDYACINKPYYTDFGGIDDDGDSLVYSIVTPLNTKDASAIPPPRPGPYPLVTWRNPYGINNVINGSPDLRISRDGFLTVTPRTQGLFVFAVKVDEYRDGTKIGETRRDFQMLVLDCARAVPPQILGKKLTDASFTFDQTMNVSFDASTPDDQRCIQVRISDDDSKNEFDGQERIRIKAIPINFKKDLSGITFDATTATLINGSTADFKICLPKCPYRAGGAYEIGIVAMDDACSLPLTDTLKVSVFVEPPPNKKPYFVSPNPVNASIPEGTQAAWPYEARDDDNDPLVVSVLTNGFSLKRAGMFYEPFTLTDGSATGQIRWDAFCNIYNFTKRTDFRVTIQVEDQDFCKLDDPARAVYNLRVILPGNSDPIIDTDLTPAVSERTIKGLTRRINEPFTFNVTGRDQPDNDFIVLKGSGKDFTFDQFGISFDSAKGNGLVNSRFTWNIQCKTVDLKKKDTFDFQFIVVDQANKCRFYKADTLDMEVKILPPLNQAPTLTVSNNNAPATTLYNNSVSTILGNKIDLLLTGIDADVVPAKDSIKIELIKADGSVEPVGYLFKKVAGTSPLQTSFTWQPDCSIYENNVYENDYQFMFRISDNRCLVPKRDSVNLTIKIKDVDGSDGGFVPPNFFSPNGDDVNDYFAMEIKDPNTNEFKNILPNDNCLSRFESVRIFNRWGNLVFESPDRNFKWYAVGESAGVYYYFVKFSKKEYRGTLSLRY